MPASPPDTGDLNFAWSRALVAGFAAAGIGHAVISPGSRSTPLALALLRQPGMRCQVLLDERSAAFFALGIAKAEGRPVLLLATSGTAPANWLPAVIEASQAGHPLILLSADRPPEQQACGANQTIDQLKLFGSHVRASHALGTPEAGFDPAYLHRLAARCAEEARWPLPGPVHINQPFREPLLPRGEAPPPAPLPALRLAAPAAAPASGAIADLAARLAGRPGAIVCGEGPYPPCFPAAVAALAAALDCPILAEPLSGLRFGPHDRSRLFCHYDAWLRRGDFGGAGRPDWLLRFGAFPVTRSLQAFATGARQTIALVEPLPRWSDPGHGLTHVLRADPRAVCEALLAASPAPAPAGWLAAFRQAEADAQGRLAGDEGDWEGSLLPAILARLPAACPVFIGNSMLIRDMDGFGGGGAKPLHFFGNRGASGIDGNISTALGIAAARGRVAALLGDLTFQHDVGGLAAARGLDAILMVFNNGGGGIFDYLPQAALPEFEAGWLTPQAADIAALARGFGLGHVRARGRAEVDAALAEALAAGGPRVIEVAINRETSLARHRAYWRHFSG